MKKAPLWGRGRIRELPGQYFDEESGLHYNYQRIYHPGLGRYLEPDPLGQRDSANVYPYVGSNPSNLTDATGQAVDVFLDVGFIGWDIYNIFYGDKCERGENIKALGLDVLGAALPFATGLGVAYKAGKAANRLSNVLPTNGVFARVMPAKYAKAFASGKGSLGGGSEVFVTAMDDLSAITTRKGAQKRLSLFSDYAGTDPSLAGDMVVQFKVQDLNAIGLRSPIETNPVRGYGFTHGGRTGGGAREWLFNNGTADELGIYDINLMPLR